VAPASIFFSIFEAAGRGILREMKKKWLILFSLCVCCTRLAAQYDDLLHKTHGQRYPYLYSLYDRKIADPDSSRAFSDINIVEKLAIQNGDNDLLLETKAMKVSYYYYQSAFGHYPPELAKTKIYALLNEAEKKGVVWLQARMENALVAFYSSVKQYENAFEHAHKMYVIFSKSSIEECPEKNAFLCDFANSLYLYRDYRLALQYLAEASQDSLPRPWNPYFIQRPNTMGLCYRALGKPDSSTYYFVMAKQRAVRMGLHDWEAICDGNIGENYFLQKNYEKAKPLLQNNADSSAARQDWGVAANALTILANISLRQNDLRSAGRQLMKARAYAYWSKQDTRLARLYPLLSRFYILTGDRAMASAYLDSSLAARDSIDREYNTLYMTRAMQKVELEKEHSAILQLDNERKMRTLQRNALVVIVILGLSVVFFIYDKQKRLYREKNEQLKRTAEELGQAARDLDNFTKSVAEKNNLIETLQRQIGTPDPEVLTQLRESTILTEEQWLDFKKMFNKLHVGYMQRLQEKLPSLSPAETRFVVLSKLKLSGREMAAMLGVGADAIRKYRSRLRKKLELPEDESLDELIANI
jgi:DNA-directed RNA polymerase specialized sigma24 family protein